MENARNRPTYFAIFAISLAVILLEISYTRVFSFKVYYYFTYLIIGISLLGLGAGGIFVTLSKRMRSTPLSVLVPLSSVAAGLMVAAGYLLIAPLPLEVSVLTAFGIAKLAVASLLLFLPFMLAGVAITSILSSHPGEVHRLYGADLLGAGLGCAVAVPLLYGLAPPGVILVSALILAAAGIPMALPLEQTALRFAPLVGTGVIALVPVVLGGLPDPAVDPHKTLKTSREEGRVLHTDWSPVFRIDVTEHPAGDPNLHLIEHDGQLGSTLHRFDGDVSSLDRFDSNPRSYPFQVLPKSPKVLIIGSAGGHEVLASLYFGAEHVTGVELNPATLALLREHFADFSGHLPENPRVTFVNAEGRSYLKRRDETYDLIWLVAPDSYAAMNAASSAAFVLAESYLYTAEMIRESLAHLNPGGVLCAQFGELDYERKPNRTARFLRSARLAMTEAGISDFGRHVLVATNPELHPFALSTILLGRSAFTPDQIQRFVRNTPRVPNARVRQAPGIASEKDAVGKIIRLPDAQLDGWIRSQPYDLSPVTDDAPFFWHFVRFRDAFRDPSHGSNALDWEDAIGERILAVLLLLVTAFAAVFMLLPLIALREVWRGIPYKANAALYFAALGMGFMLIEVSLIQMLTLLLGYPTYSLSVTLFGLLIFTGIGSLLSERLRWSRARTLQALAGALFLLVAFLQLGLPALIDGIIGAPLAVRVGLAVVVIAPVGLVLGSFMPLGLETVAGLTSHSREYVAWAWALNGFFSVITSIASTILAMSFGFQVVLGLALLIYVVGIAALLRVPETAD